MNYFNKLNKPFSHSLLTRAVLCGLTACSVNSFAQEQTSTEVKEERKFEVIQVTAQKRVENSQEVPIPLTAFSSDSLRKLGAQSIEDLGAATPGLDTNSRSAVVPKIGIRGVTNNSAGIGSSSNVVIYQDGVYSGRSGSAVVNFNDIRSVEVLKGPQGTLFGKNAAAGAILIHTKKPIDEHEGNYRVTLGNYNKRKFEGLYNFPITDNVYFRGSAVINRRDGHIDTLRYVAPPESSDDSDFQKVDFGNEKDLSLRAAILWDISDKAELLWRSEFNELDQDGKSSYSVNPDVYRGGGTGVDLFGTYETDFESVVGRNLFGSSIEFNYEFDWANFTSITAYKRYSTYSYSDEDGSANKRVMFNDLLDEELDYVSQEFRLAGAISGGLKWTLGASYSHDQLEQTNTRQMMTDTLDSFAYNGALSANGLPATGNSQIPGVIGIPGGTGLTGFFLQNPGLNQLFSLLSQASGVPKKQLANMVAIDNLNRPWAEQNINTGDYTSFGLFADMTYPITDRLDLTVGARWSKDEKDFSTLSYAQNNLEINLPGVPPQLQKIPQAFIFPENYVEGSNGEKLAVEQNGSWSQVTPRVVLDYKLNDNVMFYVSYTEGYKAGGFNATSIGSVDQEDITNYEIGLKSTLFDNSVRFNVSAFNYDYENFQLRLLVEPGGGALPHLEVINADANGSGLEFEASWLATDDLTFKLNYSYVNAELSEQDLTEEQESMGIPDLEGLALPNSPKNKLFAAVDYFIELDDGEINMNLNYSYTDERTFLDGTVLLPVEPDEIQGLTKENNVDAYGLTNFRISYLSMNEWELSFFANNLFDVEYAQQGIRGAGDSFGSPVIKGLGEPRMFGIEFSQTF